MSREKVLVIVESPKKIEKISHILKDNITDKDYVVLATMGHIADLSNKGKKNLGINIEDGFKPKYVLMPDKIEKLNTILTTGSACDKILLATDPDREGECISSLVYERITSLNKPIKRVVFKAIDKESIISGIKAERDIDDNLVAAAKARRVLDRIVGFLCSPFIIKQFGEGTSAGRVQSVALRMIVDREDEIQNFKPEEYWNIKISFTKEKLEHFMASYYSKNSISSKDEAEKLYEELKNSTFTVKKIVAKPKPKNPLPPLNTAKMQSCAYTRYKLSPKSTMDAAQRLYETGRISYIRTDSVRVENEALNMVRNWICKNHPEQLPKKANVYKNKASSQNTQDAHEAIRPLSVDELPLEHPQTDDDKLYKVIWEIFVASQMTPAIYDTTSFVIMSDKKREFRVTGKVLKEPGWLIIASNFDLENNEDDRLPKLQENDELKVVAPGIVLEQKFTQPPSRYKKYTLIEELESNGIGRPSTYASIMEKICQRNFLVEKKDILYPTETGIKIVNSLKDHFSFMKYNFTKNLESMLDLIEHGKCSYIDAMNYFYKPFEKELQSAYQKSDYNTGFKCPKCKANMLLKESKYGKFLGCENYPDCKSTIAVVVDKNGKITKKEEEKKLAPDNILCPKCNSQMFIRTARFGEYYCCLKYPVCSGHRNIPCGKKCPNCGNDLFETFWAKEPYCSKVRCCMGYPDCNYVEKVEP